MMSHIPLIPNPPAYTTYIVYGRKYYGNQTPVRNLFTRNTFTEWIMNLRAHTRYSCDRRCVILQVTLVVSVLLLSKAPSCWKPTNKIVLVLQVFLGLSLLLFWKLKCKLLEIWEFKLGLRGCNLFYFRGGELHTLGTLLVHLPIKLLQIISARSESFLNRTQGSHWSYETHLLLVFTPLFVYRLLRHFLGFFQLFSRPFQCSQFTAQSFELKQ